MPHMPDRYRPIVQMVRSVLTDDLRTKKYRGNPNRIAGHCYVASEVLFHILGGWLVGWSAQVVRHEGDTHWYLKNRDTGRILDATADQFTTPVDYTKGRGCGFLTVRPSKRAQIVMERLEMKGVHSYV